MDKLDKVDKFESGRPTKNLSLPDLLGRMSEMRKELLPDMTIKEFGDYWLENIVLNKSSKPTYETYKSKWNCHVKSSITDELTLSNIEPYHVQHLLDKMLSDGYAISTVYAVYDTVNAALNYARNSGLRRDNIMHEIILPERDKFQAYICSKDELAYINEKSKNTVLEIPILLASQLGLRRSQILALQWKDCDFTNHTISINKSIVRSKHREFHRGKERRIRIIPIPEIVEDRLLAWKQEQAEKLLLRGKQQTLDTLICSTVRAIPMERTYLDKLFRKFVNESSLPPQLRFHDLRWSYINLELKSQPLKLVSETVGHSSCVYTIDYYVESKAS